MQAPKSFVNKNTKCASYYTVKKSWPNSKGLVTKRLSLEKNMKTTKTSNNKKQKTLVNKVCLHVS